MNSVLDHVRSVNLGNLKSAIVEAVDHFIPGAIRD